MVSSAAIAAAGNYLQNRVFPRIRPLPAFRTVANGQASRIQLNLGTTYHSMGLRFTIAGTAATQAEILAQVTNIKLVIDGDAKIDDSADQVWATQEFWKKRLGAGAVSVVDGTLILDFMRLWEQEIDAQDGPGLGMGVGGVGGVNNATLSVTLAANATIDLIDGWGEEVNAEPLGRHLKRYHIVGNQAAAGDLVIDQWPFKDPSVSVYALHVKSSVITHARLKVDSAEDIELCPLGVLNALGNARYGLTPQSGWTHIAFNRRGRPLEGLPNLFQDARLTLRTSAALNQYDIIAECVEGVDPARRAS